MIQKSKFHSHIFASFFSKVLHILNFNGWVRWFISFSAYFQGRKLLDLGRVAISLEFCSLLKGKSHLPPSFTEIKLTVLVWGLACSYQWTGRSSDPNLLFGVQNTNFARCILPETFSFKNIVGLFAQMDGWDGFPLVKALRSGGGILAWMFSGSELKVSKWLIPPMTTPFISRWK